jgi:N-acyl-L-homoserine lactone synthetase
MKMIGTGGGRLDDAEALRAMFVARKEVFVDLLGWDIPVLAGQFELDPFDNQHARYLILLDDDGRHRASARLLPTTRPHILDTLFADLCDGEIPSGPTTYEVTRFCLDRHQSAAERREARNSLICGLAITALANGFTCYTGVAQFAWSRQVQEFGWHCRLLGSPSANGSGALAAFAIDINDHTMERLAASGVYEPHRFYGVRQLATAGVQ